jgi:MFS family permease
MAFSAPTFLIYNFGVFIEPLSAGLGAGRGAISLALTFGLVGNLFAGPVIGMLSDKYGSRRMILIGVIALSLVLVGFSFVQTLLHLYIASVLMVVLGAGTGPITYTRIIATWFDKRRGMALGLALIGIGLGGAIMPVLSQSLISKYGWQDAYLYLAGIVFIATFPLLFLLLRDRPAADKVASKGAKANSQEADQIVETGFTVPEAIRTKEFWLLAFGFLIVAMGNSGGLVHLPPLLTDAGLTPERAALYAGVMGIGVTIGRAIGGYLLDIFHAPYVAIAFLIGPFLAYSFFLSGVNPNWAFAPVLLFGIGMGAEFDVIPFLITRYFGLKRFGAIYGLHIATFSIGTGLGPAVMGYAYDSYGDYSVGIKISMVFLVVGSFLVSRLKRYRFT